MFTKYPNFFFSNRFFLILRFKTSKLNQSGCKFYYHACHAVRSSVRLCIHSFIPSFMHSCIHLFKCLATLHIKCLCQNFLQHNVVAWLDQHSWLQFSDNSFSFNTLLKTILVISLCWWSYCRCWGEARVISPFVPFVSVYQLPTSYYAKTPRLSELGNSERPS